MTHTYEIASRLVLTLLVWNLGYNLYLLTLEI